jgi:hypothetical protein
MGELKSAWEIAQRRANRLGQLSPGEREQQERQGYGQIGQGLAQKWLDSPQRLDMTAELSKYEDKERDVIKKAVIERLVEAIELPAPQGIDGVKRVVEAITRLRPEIQPQAEEIGQLVQEYELAEQKIRQELERNSRETLHQLRISGTAIDVANMGASPQWQPARQDLIEDFAPRLNDLKQALIS